MTKTKDDRQFELLDGRLVDIQGKLRNLKAEVVAQAHSNRAQFDNLNRKVDLLMATQEERLQVIASKIDEVLADLAALKANNPQIEDEIAAIEAKLSIAPEPTPAPEG